jgi:hypothetical protein
MYDSTPPPIKIKLKYLQIIENSPRHSQSNAA